MLPLPLVVCFALIIILVAGYGGYADWTLWSIPALALLLALNKANYRSIYRETNTMASITARTVVNWPVMLVFAGIAFGIGYLISAVLSK